MTTRARWTAIAGGSALAALVGAELAFRHADDGAFPHLNVYEADGALGTRLRPGASQRVSFHGNPVTDVRINAAGFRGGEWPAHTEGEVVMVGDSQVFGLGVEERETIAAQLARETGRSVINAGVPTYGPDEYLAVITRLLSERKPATVVLVVNASNDFFEVETPNTERHRVWDGWAVRKETMPDEVTSFPGREWLFRESHLVFALRRALYAPPEGAGGGLPSEGGVADLVSLAPTVVAGDGVAGLKVSVAATQAAQGRLRAFEGLFRQRERFLPDWNRDDDLALQAFDQHNRPGDIVYERDAESGRSVPVTAELLRKAATVRTTLVDRARLWVAEHPDAAGAAEVSALVADYVKAEAEAAGLATQVEAPDVESSLSGMVLAARYRCAASGAELLVVALPLDVQVSAEEWKKYGAEPVDMTATRALLTDLVTVSQRVGVRAVDVTAALAAAEPGAFLDGDLHMTARGTEAVAKAIASTLAEPAPLAQPLAGLPVGRSRLPSPDEVEFAPEITVAGSTRNRCSTRRLREWLYVKCVGLASGFGEWREGSSPSLRVLDAPLERAWAQDRESTRLLMPLLPGREARVAFAWPRLELGAVADGDSPPWAGGRREVLAVRWQGEEAQIRFEPVTPEDRAAGNAPNAACLPDGRTSLPWVNLDRGCGSTYADDCGAALNCGLGSGQQPPVCPEGEAAAGSSGWCYRYCSEAAPCGEGVCTPWQGAQLCM